MDGIIAHLLSGNDSHAEAYRTRFEGLVHAQAPEAVTVTCSDSRVLGDHVWGNDEPGRLFTVANIGNRVVQRTDAGEAVSGDVLYPIEHTGTGVVLVVGHTGCGAVTATYDALTNGRSEPAGIAHCIDVLAPLLRDGVEALPDGLAEAETVNRLVEYNVDEQVASLVGSDDVPSDVDVVGVVYDFQDVYPGRRGEVHVVNVNDVRDPPKLCEAHPELASHVHRIWVR